MAKLAINGGSKVCTSKFPNYRTVGKEEELAVKRVLDSGILSQYLGCWHENFYGGVEVKALEEQWAKKFNVKHAITVNSATSGLFCAVGAAGCGPEDEVIVTPYTMSATVVAPLIYNAIPVFADIEDDYFCLDPKSVESRITSNTKAIIVVDIFGHPYDRDAINAIAKKHNLIVIEDCAQAPNAMLRNEYAGTLGDIGVYSLNYHKHIHTGEGGIVVTNNDELAEKIRLIRNHAESVVEAKGVKDLTNMIGFNFRMTEIDAAIGQEQLKKLDNLVEDRLKKVEYLEKELVKIPCLTIPKKREGVKHAYYVHAIKYNEEKAEGIPRDIFVRALQAEFSEIELREKEGVKVSGGYMRPLYLLPLFQNKIGYGGTQFPWKYRDFESNVSYEKGLCPVAERMYEKEMIIHEYIHPALKEEDLDRVIEVFMKVWENRNELK